MALKSLMLRKKIDDKKKLLAEIREKMNGFALREEELAASIEEANTDEEKETVEAAVTEFENEKAETETSAANLEQEITDLETELAAEETKQEESRKNKTVPETRKDEVIMTNLAKRTKFFGMTVQERDAFVNREDVKEFVERVRALKGQTRAISGADLLIPDVMLDLIRENIDNYSKLISKVNLKNVPGTARQNIMGTIPEAVWTEACGVLNELSFGYAQTEVDAYKVGGFVSICNALLEDSSINLLYEIITMLGQAIGLAVDKAILYGTGTKMPLGILPRLAQTAKPSGYSDNDRTWVDLHTTNIISISAATKATTLYQELIMASGKAKGKYSRGTKIWCMNETTFTYLLSQAVSFNANGAIVSGQTATMPVVGGEIIILEFIPDDVIIAGYADLYLLAQRAGTAIAQSTEVKFVEDQTVVKGTARYDGKPVIAEGFVAIGLNGKTPSATAVTFAADTANAASAA